MESEIKDLREDIRKLIIEVALIRNLLSEKEELSEWAKEELAKAREENEEEYTPLEDLREEIKNDL